MSAINSWYAGKNVLVTGATGFVGKVLVERLLREFDDVNCIYLIVRGKKNSFEARCHELLSHIAFDQIREWKPKQLEKIKFFQGNLSQHNLGLSSENLTEILFNIDIILHAGADVRFDLPLRDIVNTNTMGTYRLMEIAKQIKKLQVFVFVSTAFSQSHQYVTEERHYDAVMDAFILMKAIDRFDERIMTALQQKLLKEFPNTYSFSKHLSEHIVHQYRDEIPVCVVRPSIVCSAMTSPMPNYTEGLNGLNGWSMAWARGVLRTTFCDAAFQLHLIPVDVVANTIIATSWIHGTNKLDHIEYYTASMRKNHMKTLPEFADTAQRLHFQCPINYALWSSNSTVTGCVYYYYIRTLFYQIMPSVVLDLLIWIFRRKPIMLRIQRKIFYNLSLLSQYFHKMEFEAHNFINIQNYLSPVDRVTFDTNLDDVTVVKLIDTNMRGIRKYLANQKDEDLPRARKVYLIWSRIHLAMKCFIVFCLVKSVFGRIFQNILN